MAAQALRTHRIGWGAALVLLVLLAYIPVVRCGFIWDDDALLTNNPNVRSLLGVTRCWVDPMANLDYYPMTYTSWALEYRLWRYNPVGYHVDNVILHACNACLLWLILRQLSVPGAWLIAAAWGLHPVQVESVAWVSERKNVLSGLFFLTAAAGFIGFRMRTSAGPEARPMTARRAGWLYALSLACFVMAMFTKPLTMTLACVLPLLLWWKNGRLTRRDALALAPYFALAAPIAALTMWVQRHKVGAVGPEFAFDLLERCLIAGRVVVFYAEKLLWPANLTFAYAKWNIDARVWWQYLFPLGVAGLIVALWLARRRLGRGPLAALLIFIVVLAPALGLVSIYWHRYYFVADHIQYLASAALAALIVGGVARTLARLGDRGKRLGWLLGAAMLLGLGAHTTAQTLMYHDAKTLWTETIQRNPKAFMAYTNLGVMLNDEGRLDDDIDMQYKAIDANPTFAEAHNNLGLALAQRGDMAGAIAQYRIALKIRPDFSETHYNLGIALVSRRDLTGAANEYRADLAARPRHADAHNNLGLVLGAAGHKHEAVEELAIAVALQPQQPEFHLNLGLAYLADAQPTAATTQLRTAMAAAPPSVEFLMRLGRGLAAAGQPQDAARCFDRILQLQPGSGVAHAALADALDALGRRSEASQHREAGRALGVDPAATQTQSAPP